MTLTLDQVRHIAQLARLRLTPDEESRYREQLSAILDYAARLARIDTTAIPPTATVLPLHAPLRQDQPRSGVPRERILANAAAAEEGMFRIPPVFDDGTPTTSGACPDRSLPA
ncbi:MAG: Asp-tRNA(Asn)/Glu-tRNA(Gln) amidotransferase subunit GatC [Chloroflexota bacterium]